MEIEKLLEQAQSGDLGAQEELFLRYRPLLLSRSMVEQGFLEDLYQELSITFLGCIQSFSLEEARKRLK